RVPGDVVRNIGLVLVIAALTWAWRPDFRLPNLRSDGPSWQRGVAAAETQCRDPGATTAVVPQSPPPRWVVRLPCAVVRDRS
ncbi:MAG TPA: hypothetical protein VHN80_08430, partial [Kineosporiaceae bacterium]|nr:hypothetical protein [Kineosporiaceae bacterium]